MLWNMVGCEAWRGWGKWAWCVIVNRRELEGI
jgi:hypothetical protein